MKRQAFTLVELVVVILILGILAGVAAPRFLDTADDANEASIRQTLAVVRDAIELFNAQQGSLPLSGGGADAAAFNTELEEYLRSAVPPSPIGPNDGSIAVVNTDNPTGNSPATSDWIYSTSDGTFINGSSDQAPSGANYDQL